MQELTEKRLKRQVIGKQHRFLAVVPLGFEQTLVNEIESIRRQFIQSEQAAEPFEIGIAGDGKVEFVAKITEAWKYVAYSRIANRILMHIADFKAENFRELEKKSADVPWELYLASANVSIHVSCKHSRLYHSDAIAERLQNVIEGGSLPLASQRHAVSATPSAGTPRNTPQHLFANFLDDRCTIWLDLAGEELYKRGHERFVNDAPLKETIAAGMLFEAFNLNHGTPVTLFDLMAGSGTYSLEAAYITNKLIPGVCRDFSLKHQPAFKEATWNFILKQAPSSPAFRTFTSDISERAVEIIRHNVECSPLANIAPAPIVPELKDFFSYSVQDIADACQGESSPVIVLNPPYGKRLDFDAPKLYTRIGRRLAELARPLKDLGKPLTVAILAPKDEPSTKYTCTANLLQLCPGLSPDHNPEAKRIITSHGGLTLNVFIAKI